MPAIAFRGAQTQTVEVAGYRPVTPALAALLLHQLYHLGSWCKGIPGASCPVDGLVPTWIS
jgi:hypothetical protein